MDTCNLLKSGAKLVDVRSPSEFISGCLPNAVNLPLDGLDNAQQIINQDDTIILYCVTGARSGLAHSKLSSMGYSNVFDLGSFRNFNCG